MTSIRESLKNIWGNSPLDNDLGRAVYNAEYRGISYNIPDATSLKSNTFGIVSLRFEKIALTFALFIPFIGSKVSRALSVAQQKVSEKVALIAQFLSDGIIKLRRPSSFQFGSDEKKVVYARLRDYPKPAYVIFPIEGHRGGGMAELYIWKDVNGDISKRRFNRTFQHPQLPWDQQAQAMKDQSDAEMSALSADLNKEGYTKLELKWPGS
jgi:hypothetical protein